MSSKKVVWKFTNGIELNEKEFLNYLERKVFKTIRRFGMLKNNKNREIPVSASKDLNTLVLNKVLATKLSAKLSKKPFFSSKNLSEASEDIFSEILKGKFKEKAPQNAPLYFISDKELELYAFLKNIKAKKRAKVLRFQSLFNKFAQKNPDLEHNIVNASLQIMDHTKL